MDEFSVETLKEYGGKRFLFVEKVHISAAFK